LMRLCALSFTGAFSSSPQARLSHRFLGLMVGQGSL